MIAAPPVRMQREEHVPFLLIDDGFAEHRKLEALSDAAFRAFMHSLCYAARNQTDGFIPERTARVIAPAKATRELVDGVLWHRCDGGYLIHDYLDYNPSKQQISERKQATKERVAAWRARNGNHAS